MTETTEILRLSSPADIVEAVPYVLGFQPHDSLVVLSLRGERRRLGLTARVDLAHPGTTRDTAAMLAGHLVEDGAGAAILVTYTATEAAARSLVIAMRHELRRSGVALAEALHVSEDRWISYTCRRPCCPPAGTRLPDRLRNPGRVGVAAVAAGMGVLPSRDAIAATLAPVERLLHIEMAGAIDRHTRHFAAVAPTLRRGAYGDATMALVRDWVGRLAGNRVELGIDPAARILVGLQDRDVRDRCLPWGSSCTGEPDLGPDAARLWTALVRRAVQPNLVAAPATLLAWCAYLHEGDGVLANIALERALADDDQYTMARYLLQITQAGIPPAGAREMLEGDDSRAAAG